MGITMPILTVCAFELPAAAAVMPSIAMVRVIELLNMAVLRRVVGAGSLAVGLSNGRLAGNAVVLWPRIAVV
jgi:hypothetical protein